MSDLETLARCRKAIQQEVPFVDVKPYSHNIISLVLSKIARTWGQASANKTIRDFDLKSLGWHEVKPQEPT